MGTESGEALGAAFSISQTEVKRGVEEGTSSWAPCRQNEEDR